MKEIERDELNITRSLLDFSIESKEVTLEELWDPEESSSEVTMVMDRTIPDPRTKLTYHTKEGTYYSNS